MYKIVKRYQFSELIQTGKNTYTVTNGDQQIENLNKEQANNLFLILKNLTR